MIASVRESKARLSELISKANAGEDVVISVHGRPSVKLVPVAPETNTPEISQWIARRRTRLRSMPAGPASSPDIVDLLRGDRI